MRWSDRIFGLCAIVLGAAYVWLALRIETPFAVDPLGPRTFPVIVGTVLALTGLWPLLLPDPEPAWPRGRNLAELAAAVLVLVLYAGFVDSLGFVPATALASAFLCWRLGGGVVESLVFGAACALGLRIVFVNLLGLSLPYGIAGF